MFDFVSPFWSWYIIVLVVLSFAAVFFLVNWMSRGGKKPGAQPEPMGHVWDGDLQELNNPLPAWWLKMFYITIFFGIVYLVLFPGMGTYRGLLGYTMASRYNDEMKKADAEYGPLYAKYLQVDIPTLARDDNAVKTGRRLFLNYCTVCHGSDAGGGPGFPNLRDNDWLYGGAPEQIEATINDGRNGVMPVWGPVIGKEGVAAVAAYVRSLSGTETDAATMVKGKAIFETNCVACHGADGKGNTALGAPNLTDKTWLYGGSLQTVMQTVEFGRQGHMPAHREFLGVGKTHLLAAYVYSLSHEKGQ